MGRAFLIGFAVLVVLIAVCQTAPVEEETESRALGKRSLLEKLGMELHRDPAPYGKGYGRSKRRRSGKRKGRKGSSSSGRSGSSGKSGKSGSSGTSGKSGKSGSSDSDKGKHSSDEEMY